MRLLLLLGLLVTLFLLSSCKKYQPADSSFFVKADAIRVNTNVLAEGTGSHKIVDLWLYVNGKYQGTYPVGNIMPIVNKDEPTRINIFAGIKNNGISDTRIFYPFYEPLTIDTFIKAGETINRPFTFKYRSSTVFDMNEDFESVGIKIKNTGDLKYTMAAPEDCFEGKSIMMTLPGLTYSHASIQSINSYSFQTGSSDIYLELNYKSNVAFSVGLKSSDGLQSAVALGVNPQENWNKIYIQLSTAVSTIVANKYVLYIEFFKDATDASTKQLFLDNIKLIHIPQ